MDDRLKRSRKQEAAAAKKLGGQVQPRSGAGPTRKEDVRSPLKDKWPVLAQCKRTDNRRSIRIETEALQVVEQTALAESRHGILQFELAGRTYVVLTEEDFLDLRGGYVPTTSVRRRT